MVFIIVAVQSELKDIREGLKAKGHEVVDIETYNYPIDAVVYAGNSFQVSYVSRNHMPTMVNGQRSNYGVLMINSLGKSIDQIDEMLRMRCYSHLF
ncbi:MAG: YkuS family protein [Clostridia bacterium]|nr:YkuS family protein [Clostridia bacterium]